MNDIIIMAVVYFSVFFTLRCDWQAERIKALEKNSHPPIDLTPAMIELLKQLHVVCPRAPEGWYCTRPPQHHGPCAAHQAGGPK